ncbi:hypothetical protein [Winogradskyella psychrotolerans]|uniref:hypothetical protein n=1 Tax=Winogradskyella psychrotolerans TaxID=1344585 RepID=UPI001C065F4A|nr:hypothetical protein [Winogradskyella psychrotolerans]MBU2927927.1 hypothetical protein [Winogradskyella psychrotolerans]
MKNNILGGLVIFLVVVTCLLMLDDISSKSLEQTSYETMKTEKVETKTDLAVVENEQ